LSRIAALWHRDGRPVLDEMLRAMAQPMRIPAAAPPRFWKREGAGLVYQPLRGGESRDDLQPRELDGGFALCFDGRLDNRDELLGGLHGEVEEDPADAQIVLAAYRRFGESFAARLNGDFSLALFDGTKQQMLFARDIMGLRPLYYWVSEGRVIAASEIKAILACEGVECRPDEDALADAFAGGNPNERQLTLFSGIRRVLPGHTVTLTRSRIVATQHWDFDPARQVRHASIADYAGELRERFVQAVRRRARGPGGTAVFVSGGLDSSSILCQALRDGSGGPVRGVSRLFPPDSRADERRYLEDIEAHCGLAIDRIPEARIDYAAKGDWARHLEYPLIPRNMYLQCMQAARDGSCSTIMEGYLGDQFLWDRAHLSDLVRRLRWVAAWREFRALAASMNDLEPRALLGDLVRPFLRDLAPERALVAYRVMRRWLGRDGTPRWFSPRIRELAYQRSQQQRRPGLTYASSHAQMCYALTCASHIATDIDLANKVGARYGVDVAYPFADRDLIAYLMAIPGEVLAWQGTYKGLFREAMRGILPESIRLRRWKADLTQLENEAIGTLSATALEQLGTDSMACTHGYLDAAALRPSLARQRERLSENSIWPGKHLYELLALEQWLRAFFAPGRTRREPALDYHSV
jgi:asparagine synthase (glutamine-hydrolysing)